MMSSSVTRLNIILQIDKILKVPTAMFEGFFNILAKFWTYFGKLIMLLGKY